MAAHGGPDLIQDGLVLSLDAGNIKSYPGSGTTWRDLTANRNNGTLTNGPTFNNANGGSIVFDGTNDYVTISTNNIRTFDATVTFVVKLPFYSGGQRCIVSYRRGAGGQLYVGKASQGIFCYYDSLSPQQFTVGNITDNSICHVTIVLNATGTTISTYINGRLAGSATRTGWVGTDNTILDLGYDSDTNEYMVGNMYMFAHYSRVLTPQEILQNFNATRKRFGL